MDAAGRGVRRAGRASALLATTAVMMVTAPAAAQAPVPELAPPPPEAVAAAIEAPLTRHHRDIPGGAHVSTGHRDEAPVILAAAAFSGRREADARLLEQMRYAIRGGNDITANGGYPAQHDRHLTAMFVVARLTPRIWNALTERERHAIDLLMTASVVSNAFTTSDRNPFVLDGTQQYTLDGDANLNRGWNPNYREGMVGGLLVGVAYFGGPGPAQRVLDSFDHERFVAEVVAAGLTNILETFTWRERHPGSPAPTGEMIESAVRDYRYLGLSLDDYMEIYAALTEYTYGARVACGLEGGRGVPLADGSRAGMLLSGCDQLPHRGEPGMLKELASNDAGGPRSSTVYAYSGFKVNLVNQYVLVASGLWRGDTEAARRSLELIQIGASDLWYKLEHGYRNYSKGVAQGAGGLDPAHFGIQFTRPLWEEVLLPYHRAAVDRRDRDGEAQPA